MVDQFVLTPIYEYDVDFSEDETPSSKSIHYLPPSQGLSLAQIQDICRDWKQLKVLRLSAWDEV